MTVLPRRDWRQERRQKILAAAAELFGANPYDSVQMRDVAARAEVGKPTLYRYFPSKEELFLEVFKSGLDRLDSEVAAILKDREQPARSLERLLEALLNALGGQVAALRMLTDDQSPVMRRWRNEFRRRRRPFVEAARTILEQGIASGEFRPVDLETVPSMLIGIVRGGLVGTDRVPRERFAAAMIDLVVHALSARTQKAAHAA
ncbi:TetR/AcrR family transcriptional regulator [Dongia sedimenti]|uniref:TetR/AcrR family transcriptional regulator n=1 Tax=Dongia sedimenti TaxID=3064282 RepID=A0ABU0YK62_9PROT|nr:TetR/AcrR family transcriptional regulator [Rhodospirillaceae bacterium R-7]